MLEKIKDIPLTTTSMVSSKDEEYFLTYAQEIMMPLKEHYLNMVLKGRHLQHTGQGLKKKKKKKALFKGGEDEKDGNMLKWSLHT